MLMNLRESAELHGQLRGRCITCLCVEPSSGDSLDDVGAVVDSDSESSKPRADNLWQIWVY